jgi:hypothetical protein
MRQTASSSSITFGTFAFAVRRKADRRAWAPSPDRFLLLLPQALRCAGADANEEEVQSLFSARHRGISRAPSRSTRDTMANPRASKRLREGSAPVTLRCMLGDVKRTYRRVAAVLALLGVALYALLLPWHLTSQFALGLYEAEFGPVATVICGKAASTANPGLPGAPATSRRSHCRRSAR